MDSEAIEVTAAQWAARRHAGPWSDTDQRDLDAWLEESTRHRVAYLRLEAASRLIPRLQALAAGMPDGKVPPVGFWKSAPPQENSESKPAFSKRWYSLAASMLLAIVGGVALISIEVRGADHYETSVGDLKTVRLSDGSQVTLNTNSKIRVIFRRRERRVDLDSGEVYFAVAKDQVRPFVINTADKQVRAVGTAFSVRRSDDEIQVLVTEGRVQLGPISALESGNGTTLDSGNLAATLHSEVLVTRISDMEMERRLSWRTGFVVFRDTPLVEVVAEFNRYREQPVVIADPSIGAIRIGGKFHSGNIEAFLSLLQQGFPVVVEKKGNQIILKRRT